ncbi:hypothetical protein WJX72_010249 [[Myrmecia] bisecta]|uniref:Long-chain-fatty-acid--CoA ligase n=1 Tax=[Myrmecia] bisecta TaxID=41462 RepID=A0AAW1P9F6_9CHLO
MSPTDQAIVIVVPCVRQLGARNIVAKDAFPTLPSGATTLYEVFEESVKHHGDRPAVGWRPVEQGKAQDFTWLTYKQVHGKVVAVTAALQEVGLEPHGRVGMYAGNCPEWPVVLQACYRSSAYVVPVYDSLGETAVEYTTKHANISVMFTSSQKLPLLVKALPGLKDVIKTVVYFEEGGANSLQKDLAAIKKLGIKTYAFSAFEKLGQGKPGKATPPQPEDIACIMYTSGTTGNPKGVMITHHNMVASVASVSAYLAEVKISVDHNDSMLSFLTLAHILAQVIEAFMMSIGAQIGYWQGDIRKITDDISALRPTIFVAVPRVLDRVATGVQSRVKSQPFFLRWLFNFGVWWKLRNMRAGTPVEQASPLFDTVLFNKTKSRFGGRVRFVVSGGAPLAAHTEDFMKVIMCCPVLQGYGLTESCGASFLALPIHTMVGTVGPPTPGTELRLQGVEEMKYDPLAEPPRGEICLRGPTVFKGYYKDEAKTKEDVDEEGFFHTGDVGELTPEGALKVIDRLKNIFKLAQGEYVAAEKLENAYIESDVAEQLWVYGNSYESFLVAVVVPNKKALTAWAKQEGVSGSFEELCQNDKARTYVAGELAKTGKEKGLKGFEIVKAVHLTPDEFTAENGLMTPSFKLKRSQLQKEFQKELDSMYKTVNAQLSKR